MSLSLVMPGIAVVLLAVIAGRARWSDVPAELTTTICRMRVQVVEDVQSAKDVKAAR